MKPISIVLILLVSTVYGQPMENNNINNNDVYKTLAKISSDPVTRATVMSQITPDQKVTLENLLKQYEQNVMEQNQPKQMVEMQFQSEKMNMNPYSSKADPKTIQKLVDALNTRDIQTAISILKNNEDLFKAIFDQGSMQISKMSKSLKEMIETNKLPEHIKNLASTMGIDHLIKLVGRKFPIIETVIVFVRIQVEPMIKTFLEIPEVQTLMNNFVDVIAEITDGKDSLLHRIFVDFVDRKNTMHIMTIMMKRIKELENTFTSNPSAFLNLSQLQRIMKENMVLLTKLKENLQMTMNTADGTQMVDIAAKKMSPTLMALKKAFLSSENVESLKNKQQMMMPFLSGIFKNFDFGIITNTLKGMSARADQPRAIGTAPAA